MIAGYAGRIGWVDLTKDNVEVRELDLAVASKYLGGKALGAFLLYTHLKAHTDPLGPENILIFMTGPLTGTTFPAASRSGVVTRSPLTGTFLDSYSGGFFGTQLKWAGFDALVILGKSKSPVYLLVEKGEIGMYPADHLWGLTTSDTDSQLREALTVREGERMSIAAIGPAGENGVLFSNIINEKRAHGRGGAGAVMGSKNLKAIVTKGNLRVKAAKEAAFKEIVKRCRQQTAQHPLTGKGGVFPKMGTMMTVDVTHHTGTLPTRNWQENQFAHAEKINGEAFLKYAVRSRSCYGCPIGCSQDTRAMIAGKEYVTEGPDYETIFAFGSNCGIKDPEVVIAADRLCDDYGMDTISCGGVIGFAMECFEKGLISKEETGGIDLSFGNGDAILAVIHQMAGKKGIGRILSQGVKRASEKIEGSKPFAMHVKGLELPGYDPRGMKGQSLTYALSDRGGCHVRSNTLRTELLGLPEPIDRYAYENKADMVRNLQLTYAALDSVMTCVFGAFAVTPADYAEAISAQTGWDFSAEELMIIAERAWNLTRLFNVREGFERGDDTLPERLFAESSTAGPSKGQVVGREAFERMLDEYYDVAGWDMKTGKPSEKKLKALGIDV